VSLSTEPGAVTRLTVNIGPRTAEALNWLAAEDGVTNTEALRRLVALGYLVTRKVREEDVAVLLQWPDETKEVVIL
jgi:hypothetical protein